MAKTGKPYEALTEHVFEAILRQQQVHNLRVERDIKIPGKTAIHQVDVFWQFEMGGVPYQTIVECKDHGRPIEQNVLFALKTILDDIPGQPRGIAVARSGFQEGARSFAKSHGILLYELREPRDEDWEGYIRSVVINVQLLVPTLHNIDLVADKEWLEAEKGKLGINSDEIISVSGQAGEMVLEKEDGARSMTVADALTSLIPQGLSERAWHEFPISEELYLVLQDAPLPRVRLAQLRAEISVTVGMSQEVRVDADTMVKLILKDVTSGEFRSLDAVGTPLVNGGPGRITVAKDDEQG